MALWGNGNANQRGEHERREKQAGATLEPLATK